MHWGNVMNHDYMQTFAVILFYLQYKWDVQL